MLKWRLLTAIILIPIVILGIFYAPPIIYKLACSLLILLAAWEWSGLMDYKGYIGRIIFLLLIAVMMFLTYPLRIDFIELILFSALIWWLLGLVWVCLFPRATNVWANKIILTLWGIEMLIPCWLTLIIFHALPKTIIYILLLVWTADTGAYFAGRFLGKHKLARHVSPGKTIEGALGGLLLVALLAFFTAHYLLPPVWWFLISHSPTHAFILLLALSLSTALFSMLGDLLVSMLKRQKGVKDTGFLLPGHGGILDRIDSLIVAAPFFYLGILFLL